LSQILNFPPKKYLILIVGPTAVGKTKLSVNLANTYYCDIISCDSRQFYKELNIGTAKPTKVEMQGVRHHFIDSHTVTDYYSAGDFERDANVFFEEYFKKNNILIMTGGSGLFVKAITEGLDNMPEAPLELRANLMQKLEAEGIEILQKELLKLDPETFKKIDINNSQRVVRALEVCLSTGQKFSDFHKNNFKKLNFEIIKIGLERPREQLYKQINHRVDFMIEAGLVDEVISLQALETHNALQTVGYKEVFRFLNGEIAKPEMIELIKRNTRRYAKRQLTWFKNQDNFVWFLPENDKVIKEYIDTEMLKTNDLDI
jgi:tRNA dimethylallyltransferase